MSVIPERGLLAASPESITPALEWIPGPPLRASRNDGVIHRPYSLPAPGTPSPNFAPPFKNEGARNAKGPGGPTGLDASRHRGLSKR
jgi:hypothetical protein